MGFASGQSTETKHKEMQRDIMEEVKRIFKPEFLNRIDDIIVFHQLGKEEITQIARIMMRETVNRVKETMGIDITVTEEAINFIAEAGFDPNYGARPLRRAIQSKVEDLAAEKILSGDISRKEDLLIDVKDDNIWIGSAKNGPEKAENN
jgi:ATP-dependent Clp protease ATP-binding subunit ClpC